MRKNWGEKNMIMCEVVQLKLIRLRHFAVKGLWFTMAMSRFCLHNGQATKFCLQNGLATKFFLQNGGRVMHPLFILRNGAHTPSVSTKWVWDRQPGFYSCSSGNQGIPAGGA